LEFWEKTINEFPLPEEIDVLQAWMNTVNASFKHLCNPPILSLLKSHREYGGIKETSDLDRQRAIDQGVKLDMKPYELFSEKEEKEIIEILTKEIMKSVIHNRNKKHTVT